MRARYNLSGFVSSQDSQTFFRQRFAFVGSTDASRLSVLTILYPVAGLAPAPGVGVRRRRVTVVPLARVEPVLVAAARVRLNAMTASTSRALLGVAVDPHERFGLAFAYRSTCLARG